MIWFLLVPVAWFFSLQDNFDGCGTERFDPLNRCWPHGFFGWVFAIFVFAVGTLIVSLICAGLARITGVVLSHGYIWRWKKRGHRELVTIRDREGVFGGMSGGLFLMAGYIKSAPYYQYYYKVGDAVVPGRTPIEDNVKIFEEDRTDAIWESFEHECPGWYWLFGIMDDGNWRYEIRVPKGTVRKDFSI